jgi:hypothetical protein
MTVTDKILLEWSYRCHDGIVDLNDPIKVSVLEEILKEQGLNEKTARFISNLKNKQSTTEPQPEPVNTTFTESPEEFTKFVLDKYAVQGQTINGLDSLYNAILKSPNKENLFKLIQTSGNKRLTAGKSSIKNTEGELFTLIMSFVKMENGDASELWFAIMYNGQAKGGVASETGIESDVDIDGKGVSIKNYKTIGTLDFGSLPSDLLKNFKKITNLLSTLTGEEVTASLTIPSINKLLLKLESPEVKQDLKELIAIGKDTQINALKNIYNSVANIIPDGDVEKLVENFVNRVNTLVSNKIKSVEWWAIIAGKSELYLEPSSVIASKLHSNNKQLTSVINQIKGNNLFVKGSALFGDTETTENK